MITEDRACFSGVHMRDSLDSCIGCGCLSLKRCVISNPAVAVGGGVGTRWVVGGGRWPVGGGRWPVAGGRWVVAGGRWLVGGGRHRTQLRDTPGGRR
ncbi:MAG TPA: hypothetical protein VKI00_00925 [Mycobacterium sp.]|uniref:hypothetical protein n=1 Tax=Mycobacterium sp. TaxID=1785 RepID=UPI002CFFED0E|nr:hypothetical protein [Mycobacterium sp.]HME74253.1 hypothetical protein [Mycobacterium sp.]